jgi:hypothetical protein
MAKLPAIHFYTGDWQKDNGVRFLSLAARGLWWEMIQIMHEADRRGYLEVNGLALDHRTLAARIGGRGTSSAQVKKLMDEMETLNIYSREDGSGVIYNRRMVRDEELRERDRVNGMKGGNPALIPQKYNRADNRRVNPPDKASDNPPWNSHSHSQFQSHLQPPPSPPTGAAAAELDEALKAAGVSSPAARRDCASLPGLTPLGVLMLAKETEGKADNVGGLLVKRLRDGDRGKVPRVFDPAEVARLANAGKLVAVAGVPVSERVLASGSFVQIGERKIPKEQLTADALTVGIPNGKHP